MTLSRGSAAALGAGRSLPLSLGERVGVWDEGLWTAKGTKGRERGERGGWPGGAAHREGAAHLGGCRAGFHARLFAPAAGIDGEGANAAVADVTGHGFEAVGELWQGGAERQRRGDRLVAELRGSRVRVSLRSVRGSQFSGRLDKSASQRQDAGDLLLATHSLAKRRNPVAQPITISGPDTFSIPAVGESNYQKNIRSVAGNIELATGAKYFDAELVLEPSNAYDDKAVRVDIKQRTVGYLSRTHARQYRKRLSEASITDAKATCRAKVVGGPSQDDPSRQYGVLLDLPVIIGPIPR